MSPDANHHTSSTAHPIKRMGSGWSLGYRWRSTLRSSLSLYDSHSCSIKIYPSLPFLGWKWFSFWGTIFCLFSRSELEVRLEHAEKDLTMMDERIKFLRSEKSDQLTMVDDLHAELGKFFGRAQFPWFDVSVRKSIHGDVERFRDNKNSYLSKLVRFFSTSSGYPGYGGPGGLAPQLGNWERSSRYPGSVRLS